MQTSTSLFYQIRNLGFKRTPFQAAGFYIVYFLLTVFLVGALAGVLVAVSSESGVEAYALGEDIGVLLSPLAVLLLGGLILRSKKQLRNSKYVLVVIGAGILSLFVGALLGLLPIAFLTTRPVNGPVATSSMKNNAS